MSLGFGSLQEDLYSQYTGFNAGQAPIPFKLIAKSTTTTNNGVIGDGTTFRRGQTIPTNSFLSGIVLRGMAAKVRIGTGAPPGSFTFTIRNNADAVVATLGSFSTSLLLSGLRYRLFYATFPPVQLPVGQTSRILVEYTAGDVSNTIQLGRSSTNEFDTASQVTGFTTVYTDATGSSNFLLYV